MKGLVVVLAILLVSVCSMAQESDYDILSSFRVPIAKPMGLAWDGKKFWSYDIRNKKLVSFNAEQGDIVTAFDLPLSFGIGVGFDGEMLRVVDSPEKKVWRINPMTGETVSYNEVDIAQPVGIFWTPELTYIADSKGEGRIAVLDSTTFTQLGVLPAPGKNPFAITLDEKCLWVTNTINPHSSDTATINCLDPSTGKVLSYFRFKEGRKSLTGIAKVGDDLWVISNSTQKIYQLQVK